MILAKTFFHDYRPLALIRVSGEDAFSFLQGQFTNELRQADGSEAYGVWLNQKGKIVADSHILTLSGKEFYVLSVNSSATVIQQRLDAYIVADDVIMNDETVSAHGLAVVGLDCGAVISAALGVTLSAGRYVKAEGMFIFPGRRMSGENYEIIGPEKSLAALREKLVAQGSLKLGAEKMEALRIFAGIPVIPGDLGPGDLPNEGGLETTAISYTKGCYLGQEVMARLKNLGQVRRRLHLISGAGLPPPPQTSLYQGQKKTGEVRSSALDGEGFVALAMLSLVSLEKSAGLSLVPAGPADIAIHSHG